MPKIRLLNLIVLVVVETVSPLQVPLVKAKTMTKTLKLPRRSQRARRPQIV